MGPNIVPMVKSVVSIRHASPGDAEDIAFVHDVSWRDAYRGVIPGVELERMIARRGPNWWRSAAPSLPIRIWSAGCNTHCH